MIPTEHFDFKKARKPSRKASIVNTIEASSLQELAEKVKERFNREMKDVQIIPQKPSTGRNELCPCNSGKKFKKCCLLKSQQQYLISYEE